EGSWFRERLTACLHCSAASVPSVCWAVFGTSSQPLTNLVCRYIGAKPCLNRPAPILLPSPTLDQTNAANECCRRCIPDRPITYLIGGVPGRGRPRSLEVPHVRCCLSFAIRQRWIERRCAAVTKGPGGEAVRRPRPSPLRAAPPPRREAAE